MATKIQKVTITRGEYLDHEESYDGLCLACREWSAGGCEPDAENYECESCGERKVQGTMNLLFSGILEITGGGDDDDDLDGDYLD